MLKNERQYRIAKAQADGVSTALEELLSEKRSGCPTEDNGSATKAKEKYLRTRLYRIRRELEEYEQIKFGRHGRLILRRLEAIDELPRRLIQARIAAGLTQKQLARRLGLKEQQVQYYEATDYASASLSRVLDIAKILGSRGKQAL